MDDGDYFCTVCMTAILDANTVWVDEQPHCLECAPPNGQAPEDLQQVLVAALEQTSVGDDTNG